MSCDPTEAQANLARVASSFHEAMAGDIHEAELEQAKNKVLARSVLRSERPMGA